MTEEKTYNDLAKQEVSRIITAFSEQWNKQRYEFHVIRLSNLFKGVANGRILADKEE